MLCATLSTPAILSTINAHYLSSSYLRSPFDFHASLIVLPKAVRTGFTQNDGDFLASDEC